MPAFLRKHIHIIGDGFPVPPLQATNGRPYEIYGRRDDSRIARILQGSAPSTTRSSRGIATSLRSSQ